MTTETFDKKPELTAPSASRAGVLGSTRTQMDYLPLFVNVRGRLALVVGGGTVATRKAELLHRAGARITVIAPTWGDELCRHVASGAWAGVAREFLEADLVSAALVVAATDNRRLNRRIGRLAALRGVPVNVVDDPALSSFVFPAIIDRAPLVVAVGSGGQAPLLARRVRAMIDALLPAHLGQLARLLGKFRPRVMSRIDSAGQRRAYWERAVDWALREGADGTTDGESSLRALLDEFAHGDAAARGEVALVGAGPGDPDLLTLRAQRWLQRADVVVHDRLIDPALLDLARRDAQRVNVGKASGRHAMAQSDINNLLIELAAAGKVVVRLKGGDPLVFGRGGEELEALAQAGIRVEVVPGVTAASGCAAASLIPLTHRDLASACVLVTGHGCREEGVDDLDWAALGKLNASLVIYMGLRNLPLICRRLIETGKSAATPVAVIEKGATTEQRVVTGTLATVANAVVQAGVDSPTLIIVGEVVAVREQVLAMVGQVSSNTPTAQDSGRLEAK